MSATVVHYYRAAMHWIVGSQLMLLPFFSFAQSPSAMGSVQAGWNEMGAAFADVDGLFFNPANIILETEWAFSGAFRNSYGLALFSESSLAISRNFKKSAMGFGLYHSGNQDLQYNRVGATYARTLAPNFFAGVQFNWNYLQLPSVYGSKGGLTAEAGIRYQANERWSFGAAVLNVNQLRLSEYQDDRFAATLRLGGLFKASDKVKLLSDIWKSTEQQLIVGFGLAYEALPHFHLRAGVKSGGNIFACGLGYDWKSFQINCASSYHILLGFVPQFGLKWSR